MTTTQNLLKEEILGVLRLMEDVLRSGGPLAEEYPLLFHRGGPGRFAALTDDDAVRSACGFLARNFVFPGGSLRIGLVGSVATDADYRGRGLASKVLDGAEAALREQGCALALLWAEDPDFYAKRGYRAIGWERDFVLPADLAENLPEADGIRPYEGADAEAVHRLYDGHVSRVRRTPEETRVLLDCPGMAVRVLERDGEVTAYACMGRGADFRDTVHEWGGPTEAVLALLRGILEEHFSGREDANLFVVAPPTSVELCQRLETLGCGPVDGVLGMAKVLDLEPLAELFARSVLPKDRVVIHKDEAGARVGLIGPQGEAQMAAEDVLALLFAPYGLGQDLDFVAENFELDLSRLPLAPFCWGLDSI